VHRCEARKGECADRHNLEPTPIATIAERLGTPKPRPVFLITLGNNQIAKAMPPAATVTLNQRTPGRHEFAPTKSRQMTTHPAEMSLTMRELGERPPLEYRQKNCHHQPQLECNQGRPK